MIFTSFKDYIGSAATLECRIKNIDKAIDALLLATVDNTDTSHIKEYQLDDGQTKIRTMYNNIADIHAQINALEKLKVTYSSRLTGRVIRLVDGKNFI